MTRKVRYNWEINTDEQIRSGERFRWTVAILNAPREIERIEKRFYEHLTPASDSHINHYSLIKNSGGLHCKIFSFSSDSGELKSPRKIYDSPELKKDRDLSEKDEEKYETYIKNLTS